MCVAGEELKQDIIPPGGGFILLLAGAGGGEDEQCLSGQAARCQLHPDEFHLSRSAPQNPKRAPKQITNYILCFN